ncbi:hypothetical protein [Deinococcus planocerae]|uniref:hypothetical protein n=1 Tax=Deinococcus planocerae TaxID=1737569 RepID=UPI000C7ED3EC|nr:hypothetical protein [Deinococcus planocerae]
MRRALPLALLAALGAGLAARSPTAEVTLRPAFAGAVLEGRVTAAGADELSGVWSPQGRARLLRCAPLCVAVSSIPVQGTLLVNGDTPYRVALGGSFPPGQRVKLTLQFRGAGLLNVDAAVRRP